MTRPLLPASPPIADIQRASSYAAHAHRHQVRKDGITPYIAHPVRVAFIVRDVLGCHDPAAVVGALLHDIIEDTLGDFDEIAQQFGAEVATIVAAMSKDKRLPEPERERDYDRQLVAGPWQARVIKLADALDNWIDGPAGGDSAPGKHWQKVERALAVARARSDTAPFADRAEAFAQEQPRFRRARVPAPADAPG